MSYYYPVNARHFIYTLTDPRDGLVVYLGCTLYPEDREKQHRETSASRPIGRWMEELAACGVEPVFTVIEVIRSRYKARDREKELIAEYQSRGQCRLNRKCGRPGRFERALAVGA